MADAIIVAVRVGVTGNAGGKVGDDVDTPV